MRYGSISKEHAIAAAKLEAACLDTAWSSSQIEDAASRNDTVYLTAIEDGKILGVASCVFSLYEGMVENVAVAEGARRKGVGKKLMKMLEDEAVKRGVEQLCLEVASRNEAAIGLYGKCGYITAGRRKGFYSKQKDDALIMIKEINK